MGWFIVEIVCNLVVFFTFSYQFGLAWKANNQTDMFGWFVLMLFFYAASMRKTKDKTNA